MKIRFFRYTLELVDTFTLAFSSRTTTPDIIVEIEHDGLIGYGEASMPPYLGETYESAERFLSQINEQIITDPFDMEGTLDCVERIAPGNFAAKASVDIAIHDLAGKKANLPWYKIWKLDPSDIPPTSFTVGIDTKESVRKKTLAADRFRILKVKLGRGNDREMIETIREVTDKPIRVDVNQGWRDRSQALSMIEWLAKRGVELIEQPLPKEMIDDAAWLRERSPIPIIGDEAVKRSDDLKMAMGVYDGINVKLMKCGGMHEAYKLIMNAKKLGLKIMIGCMTETSCAISAASQLSPLADWIDLDGAVLIKNDPFRGAGIIDGKVIPSERPGIGVEKVVSS